QVDPGDGRAAAAAVVASRKAGMMADGVRQVQVQMGAAKKRHQAQREAHEKADEVDVGPGHGRLPFPERRTPTAVPVAPLSRTGSRRSARPGVSRIAPSSARHWREFGWRASASRALLTSALRRNRSAPLISQRSSRSSKAPASDASSLWKPSGSSTRYP